MKILWKLPGGRVAAMSPIIGFIAFIAIITLLMIFVWKQPFDSGAVLAIVMVTMMMIGIVNFSLYETYEVNLDNDDNISFRRLFGTVKVTPHDILKIRLHSFGITFGRIILDTTHGKVFFWGDPSLTPVIQRIRKGKWDSSTRAGCFAGRLPSDETVWDLFNILQSLNPNLKIAVPYIQEQMEERKSTLEAHG